MLNKPAVIVHIIGVLIEDLRFSAVIKIQRQGNIPPLWDRLGRVIRHIADATHLLPVHKYAGAVINGIGTEGKIGMGLCLDTQPPGALCGIQRGVVVLFRSGSGIGKQIWGKELSRIIIPMIDQMINVGGKIHLPRVQHAILRV